MKIQVKRLNCSAFIPSKRPGDAGYDLVAVSMETTEKYVEYGTGLAVSIPDGYVGLLFPRSSVSKKDMILANCVGVIDASYRGEIKARFKTTGNEQYCLGDKICQLVVVPILEPEFEEVFELDDTERGSGGFGSTGV